MHLHASTVAGLALMAAASPAVAQTSGSGDASASPARQEGEQVRSSPSAADVQLQDIIVTARKREENLQRAPATILAVSGDELQDRGITSPLDLNKVLPNAALRQENAVTQTFIRGVGSRIDLPNVSAAAVFTYNGLLIPRYGTSGILFDLGSVQEIAGPQGTLYGGSAAGGAVNLITAKPENSFAGKILLEGGNYGTAHVAAAQNAELIPSDLSIRTAIDYNRHDAYQGQGLDSLDRLQGRLSVLAKPTDTLTVLVFGSASRQKGNAASTATPNSRSQPDDPWAVPSTGPTGAPIGGRYLYQSNRTYVIGANVDWRVGDATFTYIPGYVGVNDDYNFYLGGYNPLDVHDHETQFSQELRWNQQFGDLKLSAGVFWLRDRTIFSDNIELAILPASQGYFLRLPVNSTAQVNTGYSGFAQAIYSLTPQLRVTAGARLSVDRISASGMGGAGPFDFHEKQTRPDWKAGVDFDLTPRILIYGNVQTGYIPFGYNPDAGIPTPIIRSSKLLAFSGGFKSRLAGNRFEINNEAYYYDYKGFQAYSLNASTALSAVLNARKSVIYGNDLSVRWRVAADTSLDVGAIAQSAVHRDFRGPGYDYSGNRMANAPKFTLHAGLQQSVDLPDLGKLMGRVSTYYNSGFWGDFTNTPGNFQRRFTKIDLLLSFTPNKGRWSLQGFVNNVGNVATFTNLTPSSVAGLPGTGQLEAPRTFGIRVTASWN